MRGRHDIWGCAAGDRHARTALPLGLSQIQRTPGYGTGEVCDCPHSFILSYMENTPGIVLNKYWGSIRREKRLAVQSSGETDI